MEGDRAQEEQLQIAADAGRRLSQGRHNKDSLVKLLKLAANSLSKLRQCASFKEPLAPLHQSLIQSYLFRHKDKDVRFLVTVCLTEIIRIVAPEIPFNDKVFKDIFKLIISSFMDLGDINSPYFTRRVKILQTIAAVKCCVLIVDMDCESLIVEMFNILFSVVRDDNQPIFHASLSIMSQILQEKIYAALVYITLRNLLKDKKKDSSASCKLAGAVIQNSAEKLEPFVCGHLASCILEKDASEFELKDFYHEIIYTIFQYSPQMLISVIPKLAVELVMNQVDVRMNAVQLVGKLFTLSELRAAVEYRPLFLEFLKRFADKSIEVRMCVIECSQTCYMSNSSSTAALEILNALEDRLLDTDEKVRAQVVTLICDLAAHDLISFKLVFVLHAAERLRDKKVSVRKKAMQKLLELYRVYCQKCSEGLIPFMDDLEQIPSRILTLCFDKDCNEFRPEDLELVLSEDLFPASLSVEERTNHWIAFFSFFSVIHKSALRSILTQKHRLQMEMQSYLALRDNDKEVFSKEMEKKMPLSLMKMARSFSNVSKAEDLLQKLHQMKDGYIFKALKDLIEARTTSVLLLSAQDSFLKRVGEKHPNFDYFRILSVKCSHSIFNTENVQCFLNVFFMKHTNGDENAEHIFDLLSAVVSIFPCMLRGAERNFLKLFTVVPNLSNEKLLLLLTSTVRHISVNLSDISYFVERICLLGTRSQSKSIISAISALDDDPVHSTIHDLCQKLLGFLCSCENLPTVLQSLGCLASHLDFISGSLVEQIVQSIFDKIFDSLRFKMCDLMKTKDSISVSPNSWELKVYGLRALVKIFLTHTTTHVNDTINDFLGILLEILVEGCREDSVSSDNSLVHLRVAAAKAVLRLSSKWDSLISPHLFHCTVLVARAPAPGVSKFLNLARKLLNQHVIPNRYACALAIAASNGQQCIQSDSEKYLAEFINECDCLSQNTMNSGDQGTMMCRPEYLVVFLIHILAHDPSFPSVQCADEDVYARSFWPLINLLQAIVLFSAGGCKRNMDDMTSNLVGILRAIKKAVDAVNSLNTNKLHILSHVGAITIKHLFHDLKPEVNVPRTILLPSSLYKIIPDYKFEKSDYFRKEFLCGSFIERLLKMHSSNQVSIVDQAVAESNADSSQFVAKLSASNVYEERVDARTNCNSAVEIPDILMHDISTGENCSVASSYSRHAEHGNYCSGVATNSDGDPENAKFSVVDEEVRSSELVAIKPKIQCSVLSTRESKNSFHSDESLVGYGIRLQSPLDRCFYSASVDGYDSESTTHKDQNLPYYQEGDEAILKEASGNEKNKSSAEVIVEQRSKRIKRSSTATERTASQDRENSDNELRKARKGRALREKSRH